MLNARARYEADTEVIELDEEPRARIARGRVDTKDLTVHVNIDGYWHRLHPSTVKTACGLPVNYVMSATRNGRHPDHPLSSCDCWTRMERAEADAEYRRKFDQDFKP